MTESGWRNNAGMVACGWYRPCETQPKRRKPGMFCPSNIGMRGRWSEDYFIRLHEHTPHRARATDIRMCHERGMVRFMHSMQGHVPCRMDIRNRVASARGRLHFRVLQFADKINWPEGSIDFSTNTERATDTPECIDMRGQLTMKPIHPIRFPGAQSLRNWFQQPKTRWFRAQTIISLWHGFFAPTLFGIVDPVL